MRDLTVGFFKQALAGANRNDFEAALKAFVVATGRQRGYEINARTQVFEEVQAFEAAIRLGQVQLAVIPTWDYLTMNLQGIADPSHVAVDQQGVLEEYLLLIRKDPEIRSITDLKGASVAVLESVNTYLALEWLETHLLLHRLGFPTDFFGEVESVTKASGAVLPVFFGRRDACVVDRASFNIMKELNPQVGRRLQIVAVSPPLLDAVLCLSRSGWVDSEHKEATNRGLVELESEPSGMQILTLFKVRRIVPFKPEYLESVKSLKAEHDRLVRVPKNNPKPSSPRADAAGREP